MEHMQVCGHPLPSTFWALDVPAKHFQQCSQLLDSPQPSGASRMLSALRPLAARPVSFARRTA